MTLTQPDASRISTALASDAAAEQTATAAIIWGLGATQVIGSAHFTMRLASSLQTWRRISTGQLNGFTGPFPLRC